MDRMCVCVYGVCVCVAALPRLVFFFAANSRKLMPPQFYVGENTQIHIIFADEEDEEEKKIRNKNK